MSLNWKELLTCTTNVFASLQVAIYSHCIYEKKRFNYFKQFESRSATP